MVALESHRVYATKFLFSRPIIVTKLCMKFQIYVHSVTLPPHFPVHENVHSFSVNAVDVYSYSTEIFGDNQLSFNFIAAQSVWHAICTAFIFYRTEILNPAEV